MKIINSYKYIILIITLSSLVFFYSCSNNVTGTNTIIPLDTSAFTYPFTTGDSWNFSRLSTVENIRPDSIRHFFSNYPLTGNGVITISGDTVINGINVKCFHETFTGNTENWDSRKYYTNNNTALICYAYRSFNGGSWMPDNYAGMLLFRKGLINFRNIFELENLQTAYDLSTIQDSLFLITPPDTSMKYPVFTGLEWQYQTANSVSIRKKYLNFENITVNGKTITTIKTQFIYNNIPDFIIYGYYSKFGELKKNFTVNNIVVTNEFGQKVGMVDLNDTYTITSYNILNP